MEFVDSFMTTKAVAVNGNHFGKLYSYSSMTQFMQFYEISAAAEAVKLLKLKVEEVKSNLSNEQIKSHN